MLVFVAHTWIAKVCEQTAKTSNNSKNGCYLTYFWGPGMWPTRLEATGVLMREVRGLTPLDRPEEVEKPELRSLENQRFQVGIWVVVKNMVPCWVL